MLLTDINNSNIYKKKKEKKKNDPAPLAFSWFKKTHAINIFDNYYLLLPLERPISALFKIFSSRIIYVYLVLSLGKCIS